MKKKSLRPRCARCRDYSCYEGKDCFSIASDFEGLYREEENQRLAQAAASIESKFYGLATRIEETIRFALELEVKTLGLAYCIGLAEEAKEVERIFSDFFSVLSICCKVGGIDKAALNFGNIKEDRYEGICNPIAQARILEEASVELIVLCGLCVGHDALFSRHTQVPVTTLIAKDRVLGHNPAAALYCRYPARRLEDRLKELKKERGLP